MPLTHFDQQGMPQMVEVTDKAMTDRAAIASGQITMNDQAFEHLIRKTAAKGDVLTVADLAGIMGAKMTSQLIPLCHPLPLTGIQIEFELQKKKQAVLIQARVRTSGKTGVEMEALTAVSVAALTIYDMLKAVDKAMVISDIKLLEKSGGKSGLYQRGDSHEG